MDIPISPKLIVAITVTSYWVSVALMTGRSWVKFGVASGSVPKTRLEKKMWAAWVPTIAAWIVLSWNAPNQFSAMVAENASPIWIQIWQAALWLAAIATVGAFIATTRCWIRMGRNWSMAVRPDKDTELITDGLFSSIRHPIYSFSLLLMIGTLIVNFCWSMLLVACIHCFMLIIKAWSEENYLIETHGQEYRAYLQRTNRFIPVRALWNYYKMATR